MLYYVTITSHVKIDFHERFWGHRLLKLALLYDFIREQTVVTHTA